MHNADATGNYCSSSCQCRPGYEINPLFVHADANDLGYSVEACTPVCKNNRVDIGEECDDSNVYCSSSCQCKEGWEINPAFDFLDESETDPPCRTICGNGDTNVGEECDPSDAGTLFCSESCHCVQGYQ